MCGKLSAFRSSICQVYRILIVRESQSNSHNIELECSSQRPPNQTKRENICHLLSVEYPMHG